MNHRMYEEHEERNRGTSTATEAAIAFSEAAKKAMADMTGELHPIVNQAARLSVRLVEAEEFGRKVRAALRLPSDTPAADVVSDIKRGEAEISKSRAERRRIREVLGARDSESTIGAAERVVSHSSEAMFERELWDIKQLLELEAEHSAEEGVRRLIKKRDEVRAVLGADVNESTTMAARRVASKRESLVTAHKAIRTALDAKPGELTETAARRVMTERNVLGHMVDQADEAQAGAEAELEALWPLLRLALSVSDPGVVEGDLRASIANLARHRDALMDRPSWGEGMTLSGAVRFVRSMLPPKSRGGRARGASDHGT